MSSVIIDLQKDALSKDVDILTLLRKAYLVARKLNLNEFEEWINYEQYGYKSHDVPDYRIVRGEVKAWNPYHGWIPVIFDKTSNLTEHHITDSMASIVDICKTNSVKNPMIEFSSEVNNLLSKTAPFTTKYSLHFSKSYLVNVIEQVRNKILDWSITLEQNGIIGEDLFFTDDEKQKAQATPVITNYINNFYSDVNSAQIQQDTSNSKQE